MSNEISSWTDLQNIGLNPYTLSQDYILVNNLSSSTHDYFGIGDDFYPIGSNVDNFTGSFDGNGFIISDLVIVNFNNNDAGLFGVSSGIISNVIIQNANVTAQNRSGILVGTSEGIITNCHTSGIAYFISPSTGYRLGGICGWNSGIITYCSNSANIVCENTEYLGGIAGFNQKIISYCFNTGNIHNVDYIVGGICGYNHGYNNPDARIFSCFSTGDVSGPGYYGIGAGVGYNWSGRIEDCYSTGESRRTSYYDFCGGFIGYNDRGIVNHCYSIGEVIAGTSTQRGFCGRVTTTGAYQMLNNFWDIETSGHTGTLGNATGKTTAEMQNINTFLDASWNIATEENWTDEIWIMRENEYAGLSWESKYEEPSSSSSIPEEPSSSSPDVPCPEMECPGEISDSEFVPPDTSFILTALKERMIHNINSTELSKNIDIGRKKKEDIIDAYSHDVLFKILGDKYIQFEEKIAKKYGSKFTDFLIGNVKVDLPPVKKITPLIKFQKLIMIETSTYDLLPEVLQENDYSLSDALITWKVQEEPSPNSVILSSISVINPSLTFIVSGTYIFNVTIKWLEYKLSLMQSTTINVDF